MNSTADSNGDVEEQQREAGERTRGFGRRLEERGAIGRRRGRELRVEPFEQRGEIGAAERQRAQLTSARRATARAR